MINFENQLCDVCGESFDKNSDIVVCPDCGTPHHRRCWNQLGHCVNRDKHSSGFEWQPVKKEPVPGTVICQGCGSAMPAGTLFCENCGKALNPEPNGMNTQTYTAANGSRFEVHQIPAGGFAGEDFRRRAERELAGEIDGVPVKDIAAFIGPNASYYVYKFRRMSENPKYRPFNWTAFLFTPLWFLFRKMWPVAIATAIFNFLTSIPTLIITAVDLGVLPSTSPLMFAGIDGVANILSIAAVIVSLVFGFLAIPMYKKDTLRRLKQLKAESNGDIRLYYRRLMEQSGPSKVGMLVVILFAAYVMFSSLMPY